MNKKIKTVFPLGFKSGSLACGIKKSGKPDLALIFSQKPAIAAGQFTTNRVTSGSVRLSQENLRKSPDFHAVIINSGNANCFTKGKDESFRKAEELASALSYRLDIKKEQVLCASTGIIGQPLPVSKIRKKIPALIGALSETGLLQAAEAIMTTDTFSKVSSFSLSMDGRKTVSICGIAKGAGMIAPDLSKATMLCFILSDANISQDALELSLKEAVDNSFNCITIDGCMSTNDTVLVLSNSCAENRKIFKGSKDFKIFTSGLTEVCLSLAKMIVRDAEGATKFIQINVKQAKTFQEAKQIGLSIANSNLVKTAMFGQSRNFGRIAAAIGANGADIKEENLKIKVSPLHKRDIYIEVELKRGNSQAVIYTSDLSTEYVKINADYS